MMPQQTEKLTDHFAIFTGGNEPWGDTPCPSCEACHLACAENLRRIINACLEFGIQYLIIYAFSAKNWKCSRYEVRGIMRIFSDLPEKELDNLHAQDVCFNHICHLERINPHLKEKMVQSAALTKNNSRLMRNVAPDDGRHDKIVFAEQQILREGVSPEHVIEQTLNERIFTRGLSASDFIICTSDEQHKSDFLLWRSADSEWYFTHVLWPDFDREVLREALHEYGRRRRRFDSRSSAEKNESYAG